MEIRPTLFVGLGSTGVEIIKKFRRLMYEQFNQAGLPIFQYLGIETDKNYSAVDPLLPDEFARKHYEKIKLLHTTVAAPTGVRPRLDENSSSYDEDLDEWLNPEMLKPAYAVLSGAGSIRMLGRLALWENWKDIKLALANADQELRNPGGKEESVTLLRQRLVGEGEEINVLNHYDVYILGTLCGGSCGGMIVDMAYLIQKLAGMHGILTDGDHPRIYALLTLLDNRLAEFGRFKKRAANCWASLKELDYYMDDRTDYRFRGETEITDMAPITFIQLVSRTNSLGELFPGALETFNGNDMNVMIALRLFNNIFTGLDRELSARMIDLIGQGIVNRNQDQQTRTLISFGVSALWNPKYRFAEAFSLAKAAQLCAKVNGEVPVAREVAITGFAERTWKTVLKDALAVFDNVEGGANIEHELALALNKVDNACEEVELEDLRDYLQEYPRENPLRSRFDRGGDFRRVLEAAREEFEDTVKKRLSLFYEDAVRNLEPLTDDLEGDKLHNLQEVKLFLQKLIGIIVKFEEAAADVPPNFVFKPSFTIPEILEKVTRSLWLRMLFLGGEAGGKYKSRMLEQYKKYVNSFWKGAQAHFAAPILRKTVEQTCDSFLRETDAMIQKADETGREIEGLQDKVEGIGAKEHYNIVEIARSNYLETLHTGHDALGRSEKQDHVDEIFRRWAEPDETGARKTWRDLLGLKKTETIVGLVKYPYFLWALAKQKDALDLSSEALDLFNSRPTDFNNIVRRSFPYTQMADTYQPLNAAIVTQYVCSKKNEEKFADLSSKELKYEPFAPHGSELDNVIVFYRQELPFFPNDLAATNELEKRYEDVRQNERVPGLHTHKDNSIFDKDWMGDFDNNWAKIEAIQMLYPNQIFRKHDRHYVFDWRDARKFKKTTNVTSEQDKKEFCKLISRPSNPDSLMARKYLDARIKKLMTDHGKDDVGERWNDLQQQDLGLSKNERNRRYDLIDKLATRIFPEIPEA
ncbi:tubulin-like doman-containing protein [Thermodesulfobacteriota bacterium]